MAEQDALKRICKPKNLYRCGFFSNTYRTEFVLNGEKAVWEIEYYRVPFDHDREELVISRFGLDKSELNNFYSAFQKSLNQHLIITQELCGLSSDKIDRSTVYYTHRQQVKNDEMKAIEVFEVRKPVEILAGSSVIPKNKAFLSDIVQLGIRLLQMVKAYNDAGYSIGSFLFDGLYVSEEENKVYVKNGLFLNASKTGKVRSTPYCATAEPFMQPDVFSRETAPDFDSDVHAVCTLMWTMINGNYFTEKPDLQFPPKYADDNLTALLVEGIENGGKSFKDLNKGLRQYAQDLVYGDRTAMNQEIRFRKPDYIAKFEEFEQKLLNEAEQAVEDDKAKQRQAKEQERKDLLASKGKGNMKSNRLMAIVMIFLALGMMVFMSVKTYFPELFAKNTAVEVTATPAPTTQMVDLADEEKTSKQAGLYRYENSVVNYDGTVNTLHVIDEDGNITDKYGNIKVPKGYVETYVYISTIKVNRDSFQIQMKRDDDTNAAVGSCEVTVSIAPKNATCKLIDLKLEDGNGTAFPYDETQNAWKQHSWTLTQRPRRSSTCSWTSPRLTTTL